MQKGLEAEDETNPHFRKARQLTTEQNFPAAIQEYESALRANPSVARAHMEIGLLYLDKLGDPVSAIFHFQKFLNARPNTNNRDQILTYIDKAKIDFAITLPNSTAQNADEYSRLKKENVELRQALAQYQSSLAATRETIATTPRATVQTDPFDPVPSVPSVPPSTTHQSSPYPQTRPQPTASSSAARSHVIVSGDSLWKIAKTYYPDDVPSGVKKIQEANPQTASDPSKLKLGTELIIP